MTIKLSHFECLRSYLCDVTWNHTINIIQSSRQNSSRYIYCQNSFDNSFKKIKIITSPNRGDIILNPIWSEEETKRELNKRRTKLLDRAVAMIQTIIIKETEALHTHTLLRCAVITNRNCSPFTAFNYRPISFIDRPVKKANQNVNILRWFVRIKWRVHLLKHILYLFIFSSFGLVFVWGLPSPLLVHHCFIFLFAVIFSFHCLLLEMVNSVVKFVGMLTNATESRWCM